jgi:hypothetical protein
MTRPAGAPLRVTLLDGFEDDAVKVLLDGDVVFEDDHVSTRHEISRAGGFEVPLGGPAELTVEIPRRGIREVLPVDPSTRFVGLSVRDGELSRAASDEAFRSL